MVAQEAGLGRSLSAWHSVQLRRSESNLCEFCQQSRFRVARVAGVALLLETNEEVGAGRPPIPG